MSHHTLEVRKLSEKADMSKADLEHFQEAMTWPTGTPVNVTKDDGSVVETITRSHPWLLGDVPVILVEGIAGGYSLSRVQALPEPPDSDELIPPDSTQSDGLRSICDPLPRPRHYAPDPPLQVIEQLSATRHIIHEAALRSVADSTARAIRAVGRNVWIEEITADRSRWPGAEVCPTCRWPKPPKEASPTGAVS